MTESTSRGRGSSGHGTPPGNPAGPDVQSLLADLGARDVVRRRRARNQLVARGEPALPPMLDALARGEFAVRWEVAMALREMGLPGAIPGLVQALGDQEQDVRWVAAVALAHIGRPALAPLFEAVIEHADSVFLREGAHHVLAIYRDPELQEQLTALRDALGPLENGTGAEAAAEQALQALREQRKR